MTEVLGVRHCANVIRASVIHGFGNLKLTDKSYSEKTTTSDALLTALSDTVVFSPKPERNISVTERWLFKSAIPLKQA